MLRLRLLGTLTGDADGRPVAMPSSERARALIGWLALHPGSHPRAAVAARLWPDATEVGARANLRTAVWQIRQAWGPTAAALVSSRTEIGLVATAESDGDGDLLPGITDEWAELARADHRLRRRRSLQDRAEQAERDGDATESVRLTRLLCRSDPLNEAAHRALLERLLRSGDRAGAVLEARDFTARLDAELGVPPSPATRAAHAALVSADPSPTEPDAAHPVLYGRQAQAKQLTSLWRAAAAGAGQVVVLTGEAGIGKTSLLADLTRRATLAGARTAVAAATDAVGETPFAAWLDLCRSLVATAARPPAGAAWPVELNRLAPRLAAALGHPGEPPAVTAPELERLRVFEAVLRLVEWSAADRPAVIALDDAHRADRPSLRLTAHVGRRLAALPLLLVLTRRDHATRPELDAVLADLTGRGIPVTEIPLPPITEAEVAALATSVLAGPARDDLVRQVVAAAEGNPLLAVESARVLAGGGSGPPAGLRHAVRATAGALPPDARLLVHLLATAARPLSSDELDRLAVPGAGAAEEAASAGGLVVRRDGRLGFRHELLREAVYADLPNPAPLHDRVAAALEPDDRAGVAHHLVRAGRPARAAREWAAAAGYARSVGALPEAAEFLGRAVELAPADGGLWLELEEVQAWRGRRPEMEAAWDRAVALLRGDDLVRAWCRRGRQLRTVVCHPEASLRAYLAARQAWAAGPDADTLIGLAWGEAVAGDPAAADALLAEAEAALPADPAPEVRADITEIRMQGLIRRGRFADAARVAREAGPATMPDRAYGVWINAACALACAGDYEAALDLADRAVATTEPVPVLLLGCLAARAHLLARLGRHAEAAETCARQRTCAARLDSPALAAQAAHDAGLVALAAGRYPEAAALLAEALDAGAPQGLAASDGATIGRATPGPQRGEAPGSRVSIGRATSDPQRDEAPGSRVSIGRATSDPQPDEAPGSRIAISRPTAGLYRAEALCRAGDPDGAARVLRAAMLEPVGRADQPWALVPRIARVQGLIARARGDEELAGRRFAEAAAGWRRMVPAAADATAEGYTAALVDLGRPPVVGLVEPARELAAIEEEMMSCPPLS